MTMTEDEIQNMPNASDLMSKEEFAAWIAGRKEVGAKIDIGTAKLQGWWAPEGDPYAFSWWAPKGVNRNYDDSPEAHPYFFVRDPESRGWVWQGDLPDDKPATMQARIDEHNREVEEFYANRRAAGRLIDIETCELFCMFACDLDPYGIKLAPYEPDRDKSFRAQRRQRRPGLGGRFARGEARRDVCSDRARACGAGKNNRRSLRRSTSGWRARGGGLGGACTAVTAAEKTYGERIVEEALHNYNHPINPGFPN
jgi:hypothetical protein